MTKRKVVITGLVGFIGSHLRDRLSREQDIEVPQFEDAYFSDAGKLREVLEGAEAVVHLAAMNRGDESEIYATNIELVQKLIGQLEALGEKPHVLFSSSTQAELDNPYGRSKKAGEAMLEQWSKRTGAPVTAMVIPNVFGDRCRPFYNSVVATFCHLLTHGGEPEVKVDKELSLIYINELCETFWRRICEPPAGFMRYEVAASARAKVTEILTMLRRFRDCYFDKKMVPLLADDFQRNLYNVFLSYVDAAGYEQPLVLRTDDRGSLFEVVRQEKGSQVFFSTTRPGIVRGNHYHTRKMEKFCVVKGTAVIRLRRIGTEEVFEYRVSGREPVAVEMPVFYTHNIENVGDEELCTLFWTNEVYDPADPDTYFEKV
ncbi:MAG TPA: NAD-dependent epimerase/dehydratase family protein [Sedimentisphaerales bacterium]|nr:NAD-dependent epimerase/dehydratase family protein [Sedimentisphaerales bacterium]